MSAVDPTEFADPDQLSPVEWLEQQYDRTQAKRQAFKAGREVPLHRSEQP